MVCIALTLLAGCGALSQDTSASGDAETVSALKLNAAEHYDAYKIQVADSSIKQYRPRNWSLRIAPTGGIETAPAAPASGGGAASDASSTPSDVTGTNTQEAGVDEPDIVKTVANGVLYIARGHSLGIVAGHPAQELQELATLDGAGAAGVDLTLGARGHAAGCLPR